MIVNKIDFEIIFKAKFQDIRKLYAEKMDASSAQSEELANISKMLDDERYL